MNFYLRKLFPADLDSEPKTCSVQHIHVPKVCKHLCWLLWKEKTTRKLSQRHDQPYWSSKERTQGRAGDDHSNSIEKPRPVGEREQTERPNTDHIVSWVWIVYRMIAMQQIFLGSLNYTPALVAENEWGILVLAFWTWDALLVRA